MDNKTIIDIENEAVRRFALCIDREAGYHIDSDNADALNLLCLVLGMALSGDWRDKPCD